MYREMRGRENCQVEGAEWWWGCSVRVGRDQDIRDGRRQELPQCALRRQLCTLTLLPTGSREQKCKQFTLSQDQILESESCVSRVKRRRNVPFISIL